MAFDKTTIIQNAQKFTIKGQIDKAIDEWQKIVKESPNDGNTFNTIGDLYLKKNSSQEAISSYLKAAKAFDHAGFSLKTIAVYKKIIKIDPENLEIQVKMADLDAERGLIGNAIEEYLKVVKHYSKTGLHKEAVFIYKKIVNLDSNNIQMRSMLASLFEKEGDKKDAIDQYIQIAIIYRSQGKILEGEDTLRRALAIEPGNSQAAQLLKEFQSSEISGSPSVKSNASETPHRNLESENPAGAVSFQEFSMTEEVPGARRESYMPPAGVKTGLPGEVPIEDIVKEEKVEVLSVEPPEMRGDSVSDSPPEFQTGGIDLSAFDSSVPSESFQDSPETAENHSVPGMDDEKVKEKLAEGEFYTQQGLLSEAKIIYETILKYFPENALAKLKLNEILNSLSGPDSEISANFDQVFSESPSTPGLEAAPESIPGEISEVSPPQPGPSSFPNPFNPGTVKLKTTILDQTEKTDFVNLMGELEGEFKEESVAPSDIQVQDDDFGKIIKEFQKGIQANIGDKDFETHFDLGVAYKEMGLRTEAIGEFQISIKGGPRAVDSAILLSQCYLEDGLPKLAIEQVSQAIQMKQLNPDQIHSLKYELASLYEVQEKYDEALNVFSEIYKENVNYRDVSKKIFRIRQKTPGKA